jgi:hypothetical protein
VVDGAVEEAPDGAARAVLEVACKLVFVRKHEPVVQVFEDVASPLAEVAFGQARERPQAALGAYLP